MYGPPQLMLFAVHGPLRLGQYGIQGAALAVTKMSADGLWKAARWEVKKPTFPHAWKSGKRNAAFPLSHSADDGYCFNSNQACHALGKPDILNLLRTLPVREHEQRYNREIER
jgi:hypothetical protein